MSISYRNPLCLSRENGNFLLFFFLLGRKFLLAVIKIPVEERGYDDNGIADKAESVGHFAENKESKDRREDYDGIIVDGDLLCRRFGICLCDEYLTARSTYACGKQKNELFRRHREVIEKEHGERYKTGESRKNENDQIAVYAVFAHFSYEGIRKACADTAERSRYRRDYLRRERGFNDEQRTDKRNTDGDDLSELRFFLDDKYGKNNGEERREFIQYRRVRNVHIRYGIKIAKDTERARNGAR